MSFKRDGDDFCLLNRLKHQRVTELLGSYIPDEEAKQLCNGRFTCLVCESRPIFDTIKMLAIHRKGKKHLQELSKYIKRKSYLELETIKKEQQDAFLASKEDDLSSPGLNPTFLGNKEYFALKLKRKISDRRKTLELPTFIDEIETFKTKLQDVSDYQPGPSPASQVRHYLKQLPRKVSLEMMVEKKSRFSVPVHSPKMKEQPKKSLQIKKKPVAKSVKPKNASVSSELSMNMSGWIKDKFGNWVKDPDAEFDSDDNEPHPVFPT